ncbi:DTX3L ligase, partial [Alaudala cheleensis]|nr:DTX3L ligase [Alaudala cheleensis]
RGTALQPLFKMSFSCSKVGYPHPGQPYKGGNFFAFLPDNRVGLKTAKLLKKAFERGLTFQIKSCDGEERVTFFIPHKTSWDGGKARNGYPDAQYLHEVGSIL